MSAATSPLIHLIDDDEAVRSSLALLIGTVGLRVQTWSDPQVFLRDFDRHTIGAIVLDVRMPDVNGLDLCRRLKADPRAAGRPVFTAGSPGIGFYDNQNDDQWNYFGVSNFRANAEHSGSPQHPPQ